LKENNKYIYLKSLVEVLPNKPGVYQYFDRDGKLLYVGKARDLKKRVSSYFTKSRQASFKQHVLVNKISDIKHIVVSSESDALLLENNLIKKHQPRYNVLLKDDKTFPWICIKNEPFPRVFVTRNRVQDGSVYYGPYTSVIMVKTILELARQLFPLRNCSLNLTEKNIKSEKFKVCLEYHLGNCKAPCVGYQNEKEYMESIEQVRSILKGNIKQVAGNLRILMKKYADAFKFEEAQMLKGKLEILEKYRSKSTIVNPRIRNADVFSIVEDDGYAFVNYLRVIDGAIVQAHTLEIKKKLNENVRFIVPQKGDKKQLLELSERNARHYRIEKKRRTEESKPGSATLRILETIRKDLRLKQLPEQMECFDNSNLSGSNPVAACVVFRNTRPSKKDYRHYHVKSVRGPDDFASMKEIVFRRYQRMLNEKRPLPQLVIIDGGKGQLNAAVKSLDELGLHGKMAVIGIAKRLEEIYFPGDKVPLYIDKNSETLKVIQHMRNEAHRFGITFHRDLRSRRMTRSELDSIRGIGEKSKTALMGSFKSINQIKSADIEDIARIIGRKKATLLKDHFLRSTT
jgi:excinuclease ABC subunit C